MATDLHIPDGYTNSRPKVDHNGYPYDMLPNRIRDVVLPSIVPAEYRKLKPEDRVTLYNEVAMTLQQLSLRMGELDPATLTPTTQTLLNFYRIDLNNLPENQRDVRLIHKLIALENLQLSIMASLKPEPTTGLEAKVH